MTGGNVIRRTVEESGALTLLIPWYPEQIKFPLKEYLPSDSINLLTVSNYGAPGEPLINILSPVRPTPLNFSSCIPLEPLKITSNHPQIPYTKIVGMRVKSPQLA